MAGAYLGSVSALRAAGLVLALAASIAAVLGCQPSAYDEEVLCRADADCAPNERCSPWPSDEKAQALPTPPPCYDMDCVDDAVCGVDRVCWPPGRGEYPNDPPGCSTGSIPTYTCGPQCPDTACTREEVCLENGHCRLPACDQPNATACPAGWRCDPAAALALTPAAGFADTQRSHAENADRGCVRLRCDEEGGPECRQDWRCHPESSTDPSGCVPVPCALTGRCVDSINYVCAPDSLRPRPAGIDVHGCVRRLCDEGLACSILEICDSSAPHANIYGCVLKPLPMGGSGGVSGSAGVTGTGGSGPSGAGGSSNQGGAGGSSSLQGRCVATSG